MSDSLQSHGLQHARLPSPSPTPRDYLNSCPSSQWCHPTFIPFSFCCLSFPEKGSFPMNQVFAWGGQSTGASSSASVLSMNIQDWFPLVLTGWNPCSPRDSQESSPTPQFKSVNSLAFGLLVHNCLPSLTELYLSSFAVSQWWESKEGILFIRKALTFCG